ncbi:MAG: hypothetical protein R2932_13735 [Caldilineaceae bacterium]
MKSATNHDAHDRNMTNNRRDDMVGTSTYSWQGNFQQPGTYYLIVENTGSTAMNYTLNITGNRGNFPVTDDDSGPVSGLMSVANASPLATNRHLSQLNIKETSPPAWAGFFL